MTSHVIRRVCTVLVILLISVLLGSCTDMGSGPESQSSAIGDGISFNRPPAMDGAPISIHPVSRDFQYPLEKKRTWSYDGRLSMTEPPYQISRSSHVSSIGAVKLSNGEVAVQLHEVIEESGHVSTSDSYYLNKADGCYTLGYSGLSSTLPKVAGTGTTYRFHGRDFSSIEALIAYLVPAEVLSPAKGTDSIILFEKPRKVIPYPPKIGEKWNYTPNDDPFLIDKMITAIGPVTVPAGTFEALEILWSYDLDADGVYDNDIRVIDEISREGLLHRRIEVLNIEKYDRSGRHISTLSSLEEWKLTSFSVPPPVAAVERPVL